MSGFLQFGVKAAKEVMAALEAVEELGEEGENVRDAVAILSYRLEDMTDELKERLRDVDVRFCERAVKSAQAFAETMTRGGWLNKAKLGLDRGKHRRKAAAVYNSLQLALICLPTTVSEIAPPAVHDQLQKTLVDAATAEPALGSWKIDPKDLQQSDQVIGHGAEGIILRGTYNSRLDVAIKLFSRMTYAEFGKLMTVAVRCKDGNIVTTYGGTWDGVSGTGRMIMELIPGGKTLKSAVLSNSSLDKKDIANLLSQVAKACACLRAMYGVVHGDIKPTNVLVHGQRACLCDFGVAKDVGEDHRTVTRVTEIAKALGTPAYMATEIHELTKVVGDKADVYSFGLMAIECFAREELKWNSAVGHRRHKQNALNVLNKSVPSELREIVGACLYKDAKSRPDFRALRRKLEDYVVEQEGVLSSSSRLVGFSELPSRPLWLERLRPRQRRLDQINCRLNDVFSYTWLRHELEKKGLESLRGSVLELQRSCRALGAPRITVEAVYLLAEILQRSAGSLSDHGNRTLPTQLYARLLPIAHSYKPFAVLKAAVERYAEKPWVKAITTATLMHPPNRPSPTRVGHSGAVRTVVAIGDGRRVVSGSEDKTLKVWHVETGRCERTMGGHSSLVRAVASVGDGRQVVSGSWDCTLKVWDVETGRCKRTLEGHSDCVAAVAAVGDGKRVVSGCDETLKVWDVRTGLCEWTLNGHSDSVYAVADVGDGRRVVSASYDCTVKVWDVETGRCEATLEGHSDWVLAVAALGDGRRVVSGTMDKTVKVWDVNTGHCEQTLVGHSDIVHAVAAVGDGLRVVSGSFDHSVKVWNVDSGQCDATLKGHSDWVRAVAAVGDGRRVVSASEDKTMKVWDVESRQWEITLGCSSWRCAVTAVGDGRRAVSTSPDETLLVWDLESGRSERALKGHLSEVKAVAPIGDGRRVVSVDVDGTALEWDVENGASQPSSEDHPALQTPRESVEMSGLVVDEPIDSAARVTLRGGYDVIVVCSGAEVGIFRVES